VGGLSNLANAKEMVKQQIFIVMAGLVAAEGADMKTATGC